MQSQRLERYLNVVAKRMRQVRIAGALAATWLVAAAVCGVVWWNNSRTAEFRPMELVLLLVMALPVGAPRAGEFACSEAGLDAAIAVHTIFDVSVGERSMRGTRLDRPSPGLVLPLVAQSGVPILDDVRLLE